MTGMFEAFNERREAVIDSLDELQRHANAVGATTLAQRIGREVVDKLRADRAGSTCTIVDDDRSTPALPELLRYEPRDDVRGTTRRERHDDAHRAGRERLSQRVLRRAGDKQRDANGGLQNAGASVTHRPNS